MRIAVDGRGLGDGSGHRGSGNYLSNLLPFIAAADDVDVVALAHPGARLPERVARRPLRRHLDRGRYGWRLGPIEHEVLLPRDLRRMGADIAWTPGLDVPRRSPIPWVQTLFDLIPLSFPHPHTAVAAARWRRVGPRLRHATSVITISEATKRAAVELLGLDPDRIRVVYCGAKGFAPEGPAWPSDPPYLLMVAGYGPHKGYREAFGAVDRLAAAGTPYRLVVVGTQDEWSHDQVLAVRAEAARPDLIDVRRYIEDLDQAYRGAACVVVASRWEGFGLPVIEAMASGRPVVAFANSAIVEVAGAAAELVPDGDIDAMAEAIGRVVADPDHAAALAAAGRARAAAFTWEAAAAETIAVLREAAA